MRNYPIGMCQIITSRANEMNFSFLISTTADSICLWWDTRISLFSPDNVDQVSWKFTFWNIMVKENVRIIEVYLKKIWILLWISEKGLSTSHECVSLINFVTALSSLFKDEIIPCFRLLIPSRDGTQGHTMIAFLMKDFRGNCCH